MPDDFTLPEYDESTDPTVALDETALSDLELVASATTVSKGSTITVTANRTPTDDTTPVSFSLSNANASLTIEGDIATITGVTGGSVTLTATCGSFTKTLDISVESPLTSISISIDDSIEKDYTKALIINKLPEDTTDSSLVNVEISGISQYSKTLVTSNATGKLVKYNITPKSVGTMTLTVTCNGITATKNVTVTSALRRLGIGISNNGRVLAGGTLNVSSYKYPADTTDTNPVTITSSDTNVATVGEVTIDENRYYLATVTGVSAGHATITVSCGEITNSTEAHIVKVREDGKEWVVMPGEFIPSGFRDKNFDNYLSSIYRFKTQVNYLDQITNQIAATAASKYVAAKMGDRTTTTSKDSISSSNTVLYGNSSIVSQLDDKNLYEYMKKLNSFDSPLYNPTSYTTVNGDNFTQDTITERNKSLEGIHQCYEYDQDSEHVPTWGNKYVSKEHGVAHNSAKTCVYYDRFYKGIASVGNSHWAAPNASSLSPTGSNTIQDVILKYLTRIISSYANLCQISFSVQSDNKLYPGYDYKKNR